MFVWFLNFGHRNHCQNPKIKILCVPHMWYTIPHLWVKVTTTRFCKSGVEIFSRNATLLKRHVCMYLIKDRPYHVNLLMSLMWLSWNNDRREMCVFWVIKVDINLYFGDMCWSFQCHNNIRSTFSRLFCVLCQCLLKSKSNWNRN